MGVVGDAVAAFAGTRVDLASTLPPEDAITALGAGLAAQQLQGSADARNVRIVAEPARGGPWRLTLRGRVEPRPDGSAFVGTIGANPLVRLYSAAWCGLMVVMVFVGFIPALGHIGSGHSGDAGRSLFLGLTGLAFTAVGLSVLGVLSGRLRSDTDRLRAYVRDQLG